MCFNYKLISLTGIKANTPNLQISLPSLTIEKEASSMTSRPSLQSSHLFAFGTVVFWASAYVMTKIALTHFSALSLGILRYGVASAILLIIAVLRRTTLPETRDIPKFLLSGAMGFTLYMITFNIGSQTLTASTGSIIIAMVPIITVLLARLFLKESIRAWCWLAIGIEFAGILLLTLWNGVFSVNAGIFWMLGSALLLSGYNLTQRHYTKKYTAFQSTTYSMLSGTLLLLVFLPDAIPQVASASMEQLLVVALLGVFPSAIAFLLWSKALSVARKTSDVSNYMFVTPLLSTLLEFVVTRKAPDLSTCIGGAVILSGLVLFSTINNRSKKPGSLAKAG